MAQRKRRPRRAVAPDDRVWVAKQVITPGELEDGGKLYPARGLPGGSGILPEEERDKPRLTVVEAEDNLPSDGLIVSPRAMARAVLDGGKTLIVKTRPFKLAGNEYLVISEREALGTVKLGDMFDIKDLEEFGALEDQHGISEELREEWAEAQEGWKSPPYYAWPVEGKTKFKAPLKTNIGAGPQVVARDVEIVKVELGWTVEKQIRADAERLFFFVRLPKALGEKLTSLSKEIAEDAGVEAEEADHATVLYLKSAKGAISEALADDAVRAARKALASVPPLEATLQGWGYFDGAKKDGKANTALVALLDCPGLAEAHVALKGAMEGLGLPVEKQTHGYVPHATVAYLDAGDRVDNLPTLGAEFRIDALELMHTEGHVLKLGGKSEKSKALTLTPDTDPSELSNKELLQAHWQLHLLFRDEKARTAARFSTEDVVNLHALVVDELFGRGRKHPAPPDEGLDDVSSDFERYVEEQPDWTEVPEKRVAKRDFACVNASGVERGDEIELGEVLQHFKDFKIRQPYVYLVGGLANRGKTKGDIDILVKDTEEMPEAFKHVLHFRLGRALPPELAERLEIHYDNFFGPFTRNVPLYDLTFERVNLENEVKEMRDDSEKQAPRAASAERIAEAERAEKKDKLTLGEFFYQPKPTRAAVVEELMTVDSLLRLYREHAETWLPAIVQKKFDGANTQIHKDGDKVTIFSEDGDDNTDRLPGLVAEIKALKTDKLVLPAEIERWKGRQHLPREAAAGYLNAKTPADDSEMVANVYDVLFFGDDGDVHKWPTHKRLELLGELGARQSTMGVPNLKYRINAAPGAKAHDLEELERAVRRIRKLPGSEGIVAKQADAPYPLKATTGDMWIKYHNTSPVHGIVTGRTKTKGDVWVYHYGVLPGRRDPVETVEVDGKKVSPVGDTFGTKLDLDTGDGILVEAETVNVIRDPKGERMTVWVPRPIKLWPGKPDTVDSAAARARRNLILQVKEIDEEGEITYLPTRPVEKQADPYMEIPSEEKAPYRYTVSQHFRGKSVHSDFRIAFRPGKLLIGWTLLTGIKEAVKVPVVTLAQARALGRTRMAEISKIDWTTGEWAKRPKRGAKEPVRVSVQSTRKAPEPFAWLDVEGKTKEPVEGKPPPVGGTRHFPGVFQIVDRGDIEFLAQKPWFHEYAVQGRALNYRLFFRQLRLKADGTEEVPDNLKGEVLEKVILPPSEEAELPGPVWLCIRPDDQTPYVLDIDAVKKGWMPPLGVSALPKAIRKQVPAEYRYWEQRTNAKAKQVRDALHAAVKAKEVELDFEAPYQRKAEKASMLDAKFVLQEQTWRGPIQIRVGPSRTLWYLRLDVGRPELIVVEMYLNPLDNDRLAVRVIDDPHKESMGFEGDIKPSHYLNPTKATPSRIEILDSGDASVLAVSDKFLKVQVKGKKFKGLFEAKRSDGDWLWAPSQAAPKTKSDAEEWQVSYEVPILKVDKAKREITGIVLEPEERDAQGEIIDEEVIAKAAHRFLARFNRETEMGLMHKMFGDIGVELYESWTTKVKMELGGEKIKKGSWLMCVHVLNDGVWKKVQDGEIAGFSIGGTAAMV